MRMDRVRGRVVEAVSLVLALAWAFNAQAVDWAAHAQEQTVIVITQNEDGSARETKVWLAVVDGQGYIRTGSTTWGGNVEREPAVSLRIGAQELALVAEFVSDPSAREKIVAAFRAKYGWPDRLLSPIRGRTTTRNACIQ